MSPINFNASLFHIGSCLLLKLPKETSAQLPSRGQVMVAGTINGTPFQTPLEPDGKGSHWLKVEEALRKAARVEAGDTVAVTLEPTKQWSEPIVPEDLEKALAADPQVHSLWKTITPMARWEWIRWIGATSQLETRQRRIEVACSKLKAGNRRPCCFNRNVCTDPSVSKNGVLLDPEL